MFYTPSTIARLFATSIDECLTWQQLSSDQKNSLGAMSLGPGPGRRVRGFSASQVAEYGARFGFLTKPQTPLVVALFVTKGGVLKTSLTVNLARMAALQGIRTCVVGLDLQGDVTSAVGLDENQNHEESEDFVKHLQQQDGALGLFDFFNSNVALNDLIEPTDLPNLFVIPETPELVILEKALFQKSRRELWLKERVIDPLKKQFNLILFDCSPNWNLLTTNALVACDLLLSPLECKINNYRNFKMFKSFIQDFREELQLCFQHLFLPTRLNSQRKLSREIYGWYLENVEPIVPVAFRESTVGEEAMASHLSLPEFAAGQPTAIELNQILKYVWDFTLAAQVSKVRQQSEATI